MSGIKYGICILADVLIPGGILGIALIKQVAYLTILETLLGGQSTLSIAERGLIVGVHYQHVHRIATDSAAIFGSEGDISHLQAVGDA